MTLLKALMNTLNVASNRQRAHEGRETGTVYLPTLSKPNRIFVHCHSQKPVCFPAAKNECVYAPHPVFPASHASRYNTLHLASCPFIGQLALFCFALRLHCYRRKHDTHFFKRLSCFCFGYFVKYPKTGLIYSDSRVVIRLTLIGGF